MRNEVLTICGSRSDVYVKFQDLVDLLNITELAAKSLERLSFEHTIPDKNLKLPVVRADNVSKFINMTTMKWIDGWLQDVLNSVAKTGTYEPTNRDLVRVDLYLQLRVTQVTNLSDVDGKFGLYIYYNNYTREYTYKWAQDIKKSYKQAANTTDPHTFEFIDAYVVDEQYFNIYKKAFNKLIYEYMNQDKIYIWNDMIMTVDKQPNNGWISDIPRKYEQLIKTYMWGHTGKIDNVDKLLENCNKLYKFYIQRKDIFIDKRRTVYEANKDKFEDDMLVIENISCNIDVLKLDYTINMTFLFTNNPDQGQFVVSRPGWVDIKNMKQALQNACKATADLIESEEEKRQDDESLLFHEYVEELHRSDR